MAHILVRICYSSPISSRELTHHKALFDSHALFSAMRANPAQFLNGTAPLNVVTPLFSCIYPLNANTSAVTPNCTEAEGTDRDSYLW